MTKRTQFDEFNRLRSLETDECILWPYGTSGSGYGHVWHKGRMEKTHRLALVLATGEGRPGLDAAHGPCHTKTCMNVRHLSWKTRSDNLRDKVRDGTHDRGERHYSARLTEAQAREILASTERAVDLAQRYGIARQTVNGIRSRRNWKHL